LRSCDFAATGSTIDGVTERELRAEIAKVPATA